MTDQIVQVGRRNTIYLPKRIAEELKIKEGDKLILKIRDNEIILKKVESRPKIARIWSKVKLEEVEKVGEELTKRFLE